MVAKHGHQRELALEFGATEVVAPGEVLRRVRRSTGAFQLKPEFSAPYLLGGVDVAVDAVGSKQSLETALQRPGPAAGWCCPGCRPRADLSAAWFRELEVVGTYASAQQEPNGRRAFDIAIELAADRRRRTQLAKSVASYPLHRWREALDHAHSAGRLGTVKVAFDPRSSHEESHEPPRIRARGRRPDPAAGRPRGAGLPAGELPARHPGGLPAGVAARRCPDVDEAIQHALLQPASTPSRCPSCCAPGCG